MDNTSWNFVSFYYSRNNWHILISELMDFKNNHKGIFRYFLIIFSEEKGENVRLAISSSKRDFGLLRDTINNHFETFLKNNPSTPSRLFPYGKAMWKNYDNNTIVWDIFRCDFYPETEREHMQIAMDIVLVLLDSDFSQDSFLSTGIYLFIKILKYCGSNNIDNILNETEESILIQFQNFGLADTINELIELYSIDENYIFGIIDSYWDENNSLLLSKWLSSIKILDDSGATFINITNQVSNIMGLNRMHYILILELIKRWHENRF